MYFWNVNQLAEDFKNDTVSERQQLPYLLVYVGLGYAATDNYVNHFLIDGVANHLDIALLFFNLLTALCGTVLCYHNSRQASETNGFIARYICLSFTIMIRLIIYITILVFMFFTALLVFNGLGPSLQNFFSHLASESTTWLDFCIVCIVHVIFYFYLNHAIKKSYP